MFIALKRPNRPRRGVTLVEMLVVVALVVLMMVILVQIFQSALGAMSASRTTQELDVVLRAIDSTIRSDLAGVTANMTPPNDPAKKQGYFEYGENAPADLHGEDTDDYLAFTTKAPEGQVFTGRQWLSKFDKAGNNQTQVSNQAIQPATVSSQVAEVIYFLRNGNLYRRVFLVAPDRKSSIIPNGPGTPGSGVFVTSLFGGALSVSWQGMNDISCRPGGFPVGGGAALAPIPNDLGDLTNRENRSFRPRFLNDFSSPGGGGVDGTPDDLNADGVNDYYPTLYYDGVGYSPTGNAANWVPNRFVNENVTLFGGASRTAQSAQNSYDVYAFPFIYPGMYSIPDPTRVAKGLGWVHYMPTNDQAPINGGGFINHSPLEVVVTPGGFTTTDTPLLASTGQQTWWGFPTWRETMAGLGSTSGIGWRDPISFVTNSGNTQPLGLRPFNPTQLPTTQTAQALGFLPAVTTYGTTAIPYGFDGVGSPAFNTVNPINPNVNTLWQDDLILTNVRSFDVKAYDPDAPLYNASVGTYLSVGYWDLGYAGLAPATYAPNYNAASTIYGPAGYLGGTTGLGTAATQPFRAFQPINSEPKGFGHEGRIPPLPDDFRLDPRRPFLNVNGTAVPNNIGEDRPGVIRLTHTFDTWSTDYVYAPDVDVLLSQYGNTTRDAYPAFPAPYPATLRGIQIQIRVTDPRGERTKVLTIRHDFQ